MNIELYQFVPYKTIAEYYTHVINIGTEEGPGWIKQAQKGTASSAQVVNSDQKLSR